MPDLPRLSVASAEVRSLHSLWGADRDHAVYLRKLGSEMRAYAERQPPVAGSPRPDRLSPRA